ncbi:hypothetical protein [Modestobacter sp. Leaf380]|uniref:hypothetical protein n=1 Tax=Modestobacter sp. Leaf380 TaxID=1736356 RepID=UPI0006F8B338|nr:hypothetical protein [Modestobacter sp. Leaf380]KQS66245.1 hypothetical protein ASG41_13050 [Modestobacter sp. Leaf380]
MGLLETGDGDKLAGLWRHVPTLEDKIMLSACLQTLAAEITAGLPAARRVSAMDRQSELRQHAAEANNPNQHIPRIYAQGRHVVELMTERLPDQRQRVATYQRAITKYA